MIQKEMANLVLQPFKYDKSDLYIWADKEKVMKKIFKFIYILAAVLLTAYLSSVYSRYGTSGWYQKFDKPDIVPPDAVFSIVWAVLYALIIWASYIALTKENSLLHSMANDLFLAQCFLQILWCFVFFAQGYLAFGLAVIILLDLAVFKMTHLYYKLNHTSGYLLIPYCLWVAFATVLNAAYVWMHGVSIQL